MALHETALEELGLAPQWVRRASGRVGIAQEASQEATQEARQAVRADATSASASASATSEWPAASTADAASVEAAQNALRAMPRREPGEARRAPAQAAPRAPQASSEDDLAWFDDLPFEASPTPAAVPARATDDASAPSVAMLDWDALAARVADCERCRLCEKRTQTVFGVGDRNADWMLIGEAPGENEDRQGEPFVGQAGKLLDNMLRSLSLARGTNVYIANVIKCRPPGNRNPEPDEVARCEPYLQRQVALVKPKLIVALGRFAAQSLLKTDASISSLRGRIHEYEG
ncbi:MAG TPA: uracil-DNA glycosylase, partial [Paraburkholderia sp.]